MWECVIRYREGEGERRERGYILAATTNQDGCAAMEKLSALLNVCCQRIIGDVCISA